MYFAGETVWSTFECFVKIPVEYVFDIHCSWGELRDIFFRCVLYFYS